MNLGYPPPPHNCLSHRKIVIVELKFDKKFLYKQNKQRRDVSLWQKSTNDRKKNNPWFCSVAVTCVFRYVPQFVSFLLPQLQFRFATHENYFAQLLSERRSVNFLKTLNYLRKDCLEVNMKQLNEVGIE